MKKKIIKEMLKQYFRIAVCTFAASGAFFHIILPPIKKLAWYIYSDRNFKDGIEGAYFIIVLFAVLILAVFYAIFYSLKDHYKSIEKEMKP